MKWIIVILVLLVLGGALYLRTVRTSGITRSTSRPHRLDDSLSGPSVEGLRAEPSPHAHTPPPTMAEEPPGSDFAHEPEIDDPGTNGPASPQERPQT